jgi:hypothetical protein
VKAKLAGSVAAVLGYQFPFLVDARQIVNKKLSLAIAILPSSMNQNRNSCKLDDGIHGLIAITQLRIQHQPNACR